MPYRERNRGVYSTYFLIQKVDGTLRPILGLRFLNKFMKTQIQDDLFAGSNTSDTGRGLHGNYRPKGRLLEHPHKQTQKPTQICNQQNALPVHSASLRTQIGTKILHKMLGSSSSPPQKAGNQRLPIPRRLVSKSKHKQPLQATHTKGHRDFGPTLVLNNLGKIIHNTRTSRDIFRGRNRHIREGVSNNRGQ